MSRDHTVTRWQQSRLEAALPWGIHVQVIKNRTSLRERKDTASLRTKKTERGDGPERGGAGTAHCTHGDPPHELGPVTTSCYTATVGQRGPSSQATQTLRPGQKARPTCTPWPEWDTQAGALEFCSFQASGQQERKLPWLPRERLPERGTHWQKRPAED